MKKLLTFLSLYTFLYLVSCKKSEYLDAKPDQSLVVPTALKDLQAILDNDIVMNGGINRESGVDPEFLLIGTDDHYRLQANLQSLALTYKQEYIWGDNIYGIKLVNWDRPYQAIFYANIALDGLSKIPLTESNKADHNSVKGSALFFRARLFYQLAQVFSPPYDASSAHTDWGNVLRLTGDVNEPIKRSSVQQTYDRIIQDLKDALLLLPIKPLYKTRPSQPAALALLAKTYLVTGDYEKAKQYADACLQLRNELLDYSEIDTTLSPGIPLGNPEIIFHTTINIQNMILISPTSSRIDTTLFMSYAQDDLRRVVFFNINSPTSIFFKGSYDGSYPYFTGIATDEVFLIRAEANARLGHVQPAMNDLNSLMITRWRKGSFTPFTAIDKNDALNKILTERRKELVGRGTRWSDLRRLNKEGANITVTRVLDGVTYKLLPNDKRYTYLIPPDIIAFHPEMPQNPR